MAATLPPFVSRPIPPRDLAIRDEIRFLHPGYEWPQNTLFSLPRVDHTVANPATFGVYHRTALLACQIIANNAFNGRLTLDQAGQDLVNVPLDDILTEREYYFTVGNGLDQYPIVPSFQDWQFPHDHIPEFWPLIPSSATPGITRCGVTNFSFTIEEAHLVPKEEVDWYNRNGMRIYGPGLGDINNTANLLQLKSDIHKCFDNWWFVIVPKVATAEVGSPQYVTHILSGDLAELWPSYHNTRVQYLHERSRPYIFARFAWAVLLLVKPFITDNDPRYVIRINISTDANGKKKVEQETKLLSGRQLMDFYSGGGSKGATSKKRKSQGGSGVVDDNDSLMESSGEGSKADSSGLWDVDLMDVWEERGRKGRQQTPSKTAPDILPLLADEDMSEAWEERGRKGRQQTSSETAPDILPLPADEDMSEAFSEVEMTLRLK